MALFLTAEMPRERRCLSCSESKLQLQVHWLHSRARSLTSRTRADKTVEAVAPWQYQTRHTGPLKTIETVQQTRLAHGLSVTPAIPTLEEAVFGSGMVRELASVINLEKKVDFDRRWRRGAAGVH